MLARVLLLVLSATTVAEATAIVVFRQSDRIVLAADSMFLVTPHDGSTPTRGYTCKVRRSGRWWFVVGGHINGGDGMDTFTLVARAIAPTTFVRDALRAIENERRILDTVKASHKADPRTAPMLKVIVGGVDAGQPVVGLYSVELSPTRQLKAQTGICPGNCEDGRVFYSASIADGPAVQLMNQRPDWLERADGAAARRLIEMQIAKTPLLVGPPIDVLEILGDGRARWIDRDATSTCAQIH